MSIKTNWSEKLSETVIREMTEAVQKYLDLPKTKAQRLDDLYTIQFLTTDGAPYINITNNQ